MLYVVVCYQEKERAKKKRGKENELRKSCDAHLKRTRRRRDDDARSEPYIMAVHSRVEKREKEEISISREKPNRVRTLHTYTYMYTLDLEILWV